MCKKVTNIIRFVENQNKYDEKIVQQRALQPEHLLFRRQKVWFNLNMSARKFFTFSSYEKALALCKKSPSEFSSSLGFETHWVRKTGFYESVCLYIVYSIIPLWKWEHFLCFRKIPILLSDSAHESLLITLINFFG